MSWRNVWELSSLVSRFTLSFNIISGIVDETMPGEVNKHVIFPLNEEKP